MRFTQFIICDLFIKKIFENISLVRIMFSVHLFNPFTRFHCIRNIYFRQKINPKINFNHNGQVRVFFWRKYKFLMQLNLIKGLIRGTENVILTQLIFSNVFLGKRVTKVELNKISGLLRRFLKNFGYHVENPISQDYHVENPISQDYHVEFS